MSMVDCAASQKVFSRESRMSRMSRTKLAGPSSLPVHTLLVLVSTADMSARSAWNDGPNLEVYSTGEAGQRTDIVMLLSITLTTNE